MILLTALPGSGHLQAALDAGANGYLLKSITGARLKGAIRAVAAARTAIDPELTADALRSGRCPLTSGEARILELVANARSTRAIAAELHLSAGTVRNYLSSAMAKLGADSRLAAVAEARRRGGIR